MVSVCVDKNWVVRGRFFQSLLIPCGAICLSVVTNRAGQGKANTCPLDLHVIKNRSGKCEGRGGGGGGGGGCIMAAGYF
jgi:hypothetical protein